jgi:hypothetical protein
MLSMVRWKAAAVVTLSLACAAAAGIGAARYGLVAGPDRLLAKSFGSALADSETSWTERHPHVRLSGLGSGTFAAGRVLAKGDVITIAAKNGSPMVVEVTGLEMIDGRILGLPDVRFQLVTGHTARGATGAAGGAGSGTLVRFMFSVEPAAVRPMPIASDRVL